MPSRECDMTRLGHTKLGCDLLQHCYGVLIQMIMTAALFGNTVALKSATLCGERVSRVN